MKSPINVYSNSGGGWEYVISRLQWSAFLSRTEECNENNGWRKTKNPEHHLNHSLRLEGEMLNVNALQPSYIIKCFRMQGPGYRIPHFRVKCIIACDTALRAAAPMDYQCSEATTEPHAETHIPTYKSPDRLKMTITHRKTTYTSRHIHTWYMKVKPLTDSMFML